MKIYRRFKMKNKNLITVFLLILIVSFFSCDNNKPENPNEEPEIGFPRKVDFTKLSRPGLCWLDYVVVDTLFVINSNEELKNTIDCLDGAYLEIDFSKHTLLLIRGKQLTNQEVFVSLIQHSEYKYDLDVTIYWWNSIVGHMRFEGLILVPKISDKTNVVLNIEYIEIFE